MFRRQRVLVASLQAENRKIRPEMAVLRPETRPDGPGRSGNSVFRPDPAKLTLPGPVRATFGHFRGRLSCHTQGQNGSFLMYVECQPRLALSFTLAFPLGPGEGGNAK